jgi:hypothetical protein
MGRQAAARAARTAESTWRVAGVGKAARFNMSQQSPPFAAAAGRGSWMLGARFSGGRLSLSLGVPEPTAGEGWWRRADAVRLEVLGADGTPLATVASEGGDASCSTAGGERRRGACPGCRCLRPHSCADARVRERSARG